MRKLILSILILIALLFIFLRFLYKPLADNLGLRTHSGLLVESDKTSLVFINGNQVGTTPYKDTNLSEGSVKVKIVDASSSAQWEGNVKLSGGTLSVVNRDIATNSAEASGEVISLDRGKGVAVTSNPTGVTVTVDGENKGLTPLYVDNLTAGEHQFLLAKDNYLKRSVRAVVTDGYSLSLNIDLAQLEMVLPQSPTALISTNQLLIVKETPTGFLRVRQSPSTSGDEVARVSPGDSLTLEEETNDSWWKVKTTDGKEGYVSTQYITKKSS
jgi:uncharacterized protein YgiM (DUF1202 family)